MNKYQYQMLKSEKIRRHRFKKLNKRGMIVNQDQPKENENSLENIKNTVKIIEVFFHAMNSVGVPLGYYKAIMGGMDMLNKMHTQLVAQIPPEEIAKMKAESAPKTEVFNGTSPH